MPPHCLRQSGLRTLTIELLALAGAEVRYDEQRKNAAEADQRGAEQREHPRRVLELLEVGGHPWLHDLRVNVLDGGVDVGGHVAHVLCVCV